MSSKAATLPRMRRTRSGITLPRIDGRKPAARRFRSIVLGYEKDLGDLSERDRASVVMAAGIQLRIEAMQAAAIGGDAVSDDELIRLISEHRRLLDGLMSTAAKTKPAGPTFHELIATVAAESHAG